MHSFSRRTLGPLIAFLAIATTLAPRVSHAQATQPARLTPGVVRVVVWDEQQPEQKKAYDRFLGNAIADYLKIRPGFSVRSVNFSDPEQGLSNEVLDHCDVLVYWSHFRTNPAVLPSTGRRMVDRIRAGQFSMITLHSAHWSAPFVEAMRWRATEDALQGLSAGEREAAVITYVPPKRFVSPRRNDPLTPSVVKQIGPDGKPHLEITLPICCFPAYRNDGKPSHVTTVLPGHAIAAGLPEQWDIPQTEMYDEPFHVPAPDEVIFEEKWDTGEHFRSGCVWNIGKGKVFYFRPGHEIYPIYKQEYPLRVVENACRWLGGTAAGK